MKTYIDRLKTRKRVEYETKRYYYTSYEDYFMGMWFGNVNVFDKRKPDHFVLHATLTEPMTLDELKQYAKNYEKSLFGNSPYEAKKMFDELCKEDEKNERND